MDNFFKSLWIALVSWCALVGMAFSIISLNLLHAIIIGFKILVRAIIYMAIVIYQIIRDEYKKNKQKRLKQ